MPQILSHPGCCWDGNVWTVCAEPHQENEFCHLISLSDLDWNKKDWRVWKSKVSALTLTISVNFICIFASIIIGIFIFDAKLLLAFWISDFGNLKLCKCQNKVDIFHTNVVFGDARAPFFKCKKTPDSNNFYNAGFFSV